MPQDTIRSAERAIRIDRSPLGSLSDANTEALRKTLIGEREIGKLRNARAAKALGEGGVRAFAFQ